MTDAHRRAPLSHHNTRIIAAPPAANAADNRRSARPDRRITSARERGGLGAVTSYLSLPSALSRWSRNVPDRLGRGGAGLFPNARGYRPAASPQCAGRGAANSREHESSHASATAYRFGVRRTTNGPSAIVWPRHNGARESRFQQRVGRALRPVCTPDDSARSTTPPASSTVGIGRRVCASLSEVLTHASTSDLGRARHAVAEVRRARYRPPVGQRRRRWLIRDGG